MPGDDGHPAARGRARQFDAVPAEDAFESMQRQVIGVLAGDDLGQKAVSGQPLVDDGGRRRRGSDMVMTLRAGVLEANVLLHEQAGRLVVELLADLFAELLAHVAAAGAEPVRFGERVLNAASGQIGGDLLAAMARQLGFARVGGGGGILLDDSRLGRIGRRLRSALRHLGQKPRLIGIEAFGLGTIETTQEQIEPMLHAVAFVVRLLEGFEQFRDHPLEHVRIVGQTRLVLVRRRCRRIRRSSGIDCGRRIRVKGNVRVHAFLDVRARRKVHESWRKTAESTKKRFGVALMTNQCHSDVLPASGVGR
jgi:hypothetical protein